MNEHDLNDMLKGDKEEVPPPIPASLVGSILVERIKLQVDSKMSLEAASEALDNMAIVLDTEFSTMTIQLNVLPLVLAQRMPTGATLAIDIPANKSTQEKIAEILKSAQENA